MPPTTSIFRELHRTLAPPARVCIFVDDRVIRHKTAVNKGLHGQESASGCYIVVSMVLNSKLVDLVFD